MNRRTFIRLNAAGGLFTVLPAFGETRRRTVVGEYAEMTVAEMQQRMKAGRLTSTALTQYYLNEIARIDKAGPKLSSVIELNPDALRIAAALDKERKAGRVRGPMHGIPVLLKDNIDTGDKMKTTAGSLALADNVASKDAFLVERLREAGAVILGKTNLSEWANFRSTRSSSGWSSRGGQTRNPYVLDRSPCGSSSGSAVAVAANLCAVAVGTETNGSIACPASMNGIVGIKPTVGLVSRSGVIPISKTQDTAGPFGRTVADAAALLGAIASPDPADPPYHKAPQLPADYTRFLDANGLKGKRIGVEKSLLKVHEGIDQLLGKALEQLKAAGAEIVEVEYMKTQRLPGAESLVLQYEFKDGLNRYLGTSNAKIKSLEGLIAFNKANKEKTMPYFGQELFETSQAKGDLDSKEYKEALEKITGVAGSLNDLFEKHNLDALCGPSTGPSWCIDLVNGDFWTGYGSYGPAALSGFPSITMPMGLQNGLPIGISFLGKAFQEPGLIRIAYAYEQVSKNRTAPKFIKSVGI
ncbi:amidase [Dyadobacter beijingensis]|uniref:Amidase n=1 Tax=Dyadobacter beijingensis TaxID=365489 RepID=A0ABQ2I903_9BACT|nr:amidase [Dyadobacter beijingensis]GGN02195.1 amidase [Dyadobacter beijingensis]